jgi:predicted lipoprotein with Yx(FWY)xxD motif/plastocyanin
MRTKLHFAKYLLVFAALSATIGLSACTSAPAQSTTPLTTSPTTTIPPATSSPSRIPESPTATQTPSANTTYTVMTSSKADLGNFLVDGKGMTLYYFTKDSVGKSTATAAILQNWPIFNPAEFVVPSSLSTADFGTITRDDGQKQATYKAWPLYYYVKDLAPGDTLGQGVGNVWFVINPEKFPPQASPTATDTTTLTPTSTPTPTVITTLPPISTPSPTPSASPSPVSATTVNLVAQGMAFDQNTISVPAGASVTLNFNNKDSGIPHNVALYTDSSAATPIFVGQTIVGPASVVYTFSAPTTAGTYFFRCDVHPTTMTGTFTVTP